MVSEHSIEGAPTSLYNLTKSAPDVYYCYSFIAILVNECKDEPDVEQGSIKFVESNSGNKRTYTLKCDKGYQEGHPSEKHEIVCSDEMRWQDTPSCIRMYYLGMKINILNTVFNVLSSPFY